MLGPVGAVLGILLGFSAAYFIVMSQLKKSNDLGDSKNTFEDIAKAPFKLLESRDRVSRGTYETLFDAWSGNMKKNRQNLNGSEKILAAANKAAAILPDGLQQQVQQSIQAQMPPEQRQMYQQAPNAQNTYQNNQY